MGITGGGRPRLAHEVAAEKTWETAEAWWRTETPNGRRLDQHALTDTVRIATDNRSIPDIARKVISATPWMANDQEEEDPRRQAKESDHPPNRRVALGEGQKVRSAGRRNHAGTEKRDQPPDRR